MKPRGAAGFTLLEIVVVLAVIGILAAAIAPSMLQRIVDGRVEGTRDEIQAIHSAIVGNPAQSQFGFVGDVGRLPASLQELVAPGSAGTYTTETVRNIGMGWRGPYVNTGSSATDFLTDAFGNPYTSAAGQVRSAGADGRPNTGDDLLYPPAPPEVEGDVTVTVKTMSGQRTVVDPAGYRVDLYYPSDGRESSLSDTSAPFSFTNVPMGIRAIRVVKTTNPNAGSVVAQDTVIVRPGSTTAAELWF